MFKSASTGVMMASPAASRDVKRTRGKWKEENGRGSLMSAGSLSLKQTVSPKYVDFAASGKARAHSSTRTFKQLDADMKRALALSMEDARCATVTASRELAASEKAHAHAKRDRDLERAIALSREEAQLASAIAVSKEEADFDLILDSLFSVFQQPAVTAYVDGHCRSFEDTESNKLEYMQIYTGYKQLVDALLTAELPDLAVTPAKFERFCEQCFKGDRHIDTSFKAQLLSADDFLVFEQLMIKRKSELHECIPLRSTTTDCPKALPSDVPEYVCSSSTRRESEVLHRPTTVGRDHERTSAVANECLQPTDFTSRCRTPEPPEVLAVTESIPEAPEQSETPLSDAQEVLPMVRSRGVESALPMRSKQFSLYPKPVHLDVDVLEARGVNFDVAPEPWLTKPLPPLAPSEEIKEVILEQRSPRTMEESQQRAEHWRRQRDLLHSLKKGPSTEADVITHASNAHTAAKDGARLALQLSSPVDAKRQRTPPEDVVAKRQAITRQLRSTFEN